MTTTPTTRIIPGQFFDKGGAVLNVRHADFGAVADGVTDDTAAIQAALDTGRVVFVPPGWYRAQGLRLKYHGQVFFGYSREDTIIQSLTGGVVLCNYTGLDSDAPTSVNCFDRFVLRGIWFKGGFVHTDDFSAPANSWAAASGRSKTLTTTGLNIGVKLKRPNDHLIEECSFTNFHRGLQQHGGVLGTVRKNRMTDCEIGFRTLNGAEWGDAAYKNTSMTIEDNAYANDWFGTHFQDLVDESWSRRNVYEPCNTACYVNNGGGTRFTDYMERCYEGWVLEGSFCGHYVLDRPHFTGSPGNFWGSGYSINILSGSGVSTPGGAVVELVGRRALAGGGYSNASSACRLIVDAALEGLTLGTSVYVKSIRNRALYPDKTLSRSGFGISVGAGVTGPVVGTDTDGATKLTFTGSGGGLAFNGIRLMLLPFTHGTPVRFRCQYRYTGATTGFTPFGIYYAGTHLAHEGLNSISDTAGKWVQVDKTITYTDAFGNAFAQGGWAGTLEIKNLSISEGYGETDSYTFDARGLAGAPFVNDSQPGTGTWAVGDRVYNYVAGPGKPAYWECITAGTPGTWRARERGTGFNALADANATLTLGTDAPIHRLATQTANRTLTLSGGAVYDGWHFRVEHVATGGFTLDVGGLKTLSVNQWCEVAYDGPNSAWRLVGYGTL